MNKKNELALTEVMTVGQALAESKYFSDAKEASQAVVKVLAGQELGIGPVASMSGLYIIKGNVVIGASIMASLIKASPKYDYKIGTHNNEVCIIEFFEEGVSTSVGVSEFTVEDAKRADLLKKDSWKAYPKNMLFSRALSNGAKWFCPDLFNGQSVYTEDEIEEDESIPDFIIEDNLFQPQQLPEATPMSDLGRQKWIESIMTSNDYPESNPAEQVAYINKALAERALDFTVTVPEILAMRG